MHSNRSLVLAFLGALGLSACGGGGSGATPVAATPVASTPVTTTPTTPVATTPATPTTPTTPTTPVTPADPAPPVTPGGTWLTFTPSAVSVSAAQGQSAEFKVAAKSSRIVSQNFTVGVLEAKGLITTEYKLDALSDLDYVMTLHTAPTLAAGTHTTYLKVQLCADDPIVCRAPLEGSPWYVPLTVTVK